MKSVVAKIYWLGFLISLLVIPSSCFSYKPNSKSVNFNDSFQLIDFCEIYPSTESKMIETIAYYSGVEEYWSLSSNQNCQNDNQIYLDIDSIKRRSIRRRFKKVHENYWKYALKIKVIGVLQYTDEEIGFGHLGLLKSQIVPLEIKILEKKPIF